MMVADRPRLQQAPKRMGGGLLWAPPSPWSEVAREAAASHGQLGVGGAFRDC